MFEATLKNRSSAHFAPVTITFPIPEDQYEQVILALKKSQIGDARMHAKVGTLKISCYRLYGYEKDADGKFCVIPEQAEIVRELYKRYESGASLRNLQDWLEENQIKTVLGESKLTACGIPPTIRYCRNRSIALRCSACPSGAFFL